MHVTDCVLYAPYNFPDENSNPWQSPQILLHRSADAALVLAEVPKLSNSNTKGTLRESLPALASKLCEDFAVEPRQLHLVLSYDALQPDQVALDGLQLVEFTKAELVLFGGVRFYEAKTGALPPSFIHSWPAVFSQPA
jgi:hypothetical protein